MAAAAQYFHNTILENYPEFRLCDGNWKLQAWATRRYSDWTKNVRDAGGLSRARPSVIQVGEKRLLNGPDQDKPRKKARSVKKEPIKQEDPPPAACTIDTEPIVVDDGSDSDDMYVSDTQPVPCPSSSGPTQMTDVPEVRATHVESAAGPATQPQARVSTSSLSDKLLSTPGTGVNIARSSHSKSPASPQPSPPLSSNTALATDVPQSPTAPQQSPAAAQPSPSLSHPAAPESLLSDASDSPSHDRALPAPTPDQVVPSLGTSSTGRPVRQKKISNPLANLAIAKPTIEIPERVITTTRKGKGITPSATLLSARNLYMFDYKSTHPDDTMDQFNKAFKALDPATKKMYDTRSKEMKAARAAEPLTTSAAAA